MILRIPKLIPGIPIIPLIPFPDYSFDLDKWNLIQIRDIATIDVTGVQ